MNTADLIGRLLDGARALYPQMISILRKTSIPAFQTEPETLWSVEVSGNRLGGASGVAEGYGASLDAALADCHRRLAQRARDEMTARGAWLSAEDGPLEIALARGNVDEAARLLNKGGEPR